jgi:hypothetical protein
MFRWLKRRSKPTSNTPEPPLPETAGEWDFLRAQPDFDADVMSDVHGAAGVEVPEEADPVRAESTPLVAPDLLERPDPVRPRRTPRIHKGVVPPVPAARGGEHATKPRTLLSELCARFQDPAELRQALVNSAAPGWTLTLEVAVSGRSFQRTVSSETVIGRVDPQTGAAPDLDLSPDDTVSRRHARIYTRSGRYWLQDLDSMNGTRHNGEWLQPGGEVVLEQGDEIVLGELCRLKVIDPMLEPGDAGLADLLQVALGGMLFADQERGPLAAPPSDVLDLALERGSAVGLLGDAPQS